MPALESAADRELFLRCDGVLHSLGEIELRGGLGCNLDGFAGLRFAAHARLARSLLQASEAWENEHAVLLGFFDGGLSQRLQESGRGLIVGADLFGHLADELSLCQSSCHSSSLIV